MSLGGKGLAQTPPNSATVMQLLVSKFCNASKSIGWCCLSGVPYTVAMHCTVQEAVEATDAARRAMSTGASRTALQCHLSGSGVIQVLTYCPLSTGARSGLAVP